MRKALVIMMAAAFVCAVVPAHGLIELVSNGGFEDGFTNWTHSGGAQIIGPGWFAGAGPHSGDNALGAASNWGVSSDTLEQAINLAPGDYDLTLSVWAWVWDNSNDWGFDSKVSAQLWVDGANVAQAAYSSMPDTNPQQVYTNVVTTWSGTVTSNVAVKVNIVGHGMGGGGWGVAAADDVSLTMVPEPMTLALLGAGLLGFLRRRR